MKKDAAKSRFVSRQDRVTSQHKIGAVSFLNTRPLLEGLDDLPQVEITRAVPSDLRDMLWTRQVEAALLPAIDLQRFGADLTVVPAGCIAEGKAKMGLRAG